MDRLFYRYVITFTKTAHTMNTAELALHRFQDANVIPVPSQISQSCGLAIELPHWEPDAQKAFFRALPVPAYLYRLTLRRDSGGTITVRQAELEAENSGGPCMPPKEGKTMREMP